jgi:hypothetical protein
MARKRKYDVTGLEIHVAEKPAPSITLFCPLHKGGGTVSILTCLFKCPKARLAKCPAYLKAYPDLLNFEIAPKYIEKYGEVTIPIPLSLRRRRKRNALPAEETDGTNMLGM